MECQIAPVVVAILVIDEKRGILAPAIPAEGKTEVLMFVLYRSENYPKGEINVEQKPAPSAFDEEVPGVGIDYVPVSPKQRKVFPVNIHQVFRGQQNIVDDFLDERTDIIGLIGIYRSVFIQIIACIYAYPPDVFVKPDRFIPVIVFISGNAAMQDCSPEGIMCSDFVPTRVNHREDAFVGKGCRLEEVVRVVVAVTNVQYDFFCHFRTVSTSLP